MYDFATAVAENRQNEQNVEGGCRNSEKINRTFVRMFEFPEQFKTLAVPAHNSIRPYYDRDLRQEFLTEYFLVFFKKIFGPKVVFPALFPRLPGVGG